MKYLALVIWISCCVTLSTYGDTNDFPAGVPNPIGVDGRYDMRAMMFTTKAYQRAALALVIQEANKVAQELDLPEILPITQSNVVQSYISPFGISWVKKRVGNIATTNYIYYISQGNKFSYLVDMQLDAKLKEYRTRYEWPVSRIDTNAAYQLAAQFLTKASMDVDGLNKDWRRAFGVFPLDAPNQAALNKVGSQAFVGWAKEHAGNYKTADLAEAYTETLDTFYGSWMLQRPLYVCLKQASDPTINNCPLPVPGNGIVKDINGNRFSGETSPIYVSGHSGLMRTGVNNAYDNQYVPPIGNE